MNKKGFTLVELLMSMAFFSFILMFVVAGFIQINRSYTRGVTVRRVQDGTRTVIEEIARVMRNASSVTIQDDSSLHHGSYRICLGGVRFGWNQYNTTASVPSQTEYSTEQYNGQLINFIKSYDSFPCNDGFNASNNVTSPLDETVQIQFLSIDQVGDSASSSVYKIKIVASSFENNDIEPTSYGENARCFVRVGDQFCDIAELETVVSLRN